MYNVTVTYNESGNAVDMDIRSAETYTLTVDSVEHAVVKATYNGTTANEGGTISNIPQGATVSVSVTPDTGYQCSGITSTPNSTTAGSLYSFTLTMPGENTTVGATLGTVTLKRIYFNNSYTLYGQVYAYAYNKDGPTKTYECLGAYPGTTMTKLDNSNIWYIEVPSDVDYVEFTSGEGYTTGEMQIPWTAQTYPKYTAPYGSYTAPTTAKGGTWGNYIYGSDNKRTNEYTVSDGTTMSVSNLFTGITATLYDYFTDGEIEDSAGTASDNGASGSPNGWIKGIKNTEYTWSNYLNSRVPYKTLNSALSAYADAAKTRDNTDWANPSEPKYGITYPLYFGDLNTNESDSNVNAHVATLYNWHFGANNSNALSASNNAATGLSGKTLANDTIHYYDGSATNENGAPMAMFDEDFLSGENNQDKALATILRTSSFPVRTEERRKFYVDATAFSNWTNKNFYLYLSDGTHDKKVEGTVSNNIWTFDVPSDYQWSVVIFYNTDDGVNGGWDNKTSNLTMPTNGNTKYTFSSVSNNVISGSWGKQISSATESYHTYYEFDSTNGKDNAYIESINKSDKTAEINYYDSSKDKKVHSANGTQGFFPFNRNGYAPDQNHLDYAQDLGFGMKLVIPFNLTGSGDQNGINEDGTPQTFDFSGDDDLWVFVDGKLVLDLGGAHGRTTGSINFQTKTITANNVEVIPSGVDRNGYFGADFNKVTAQQPPLYQN